jgi:hypothetical protein
MTSRRRILAGCLVAALGLAPATARAVDGVVEINQVKALAGGVTAGDTAGFPVTISASGSYRLTSDLDLTAQASSVDGIRVTSSYVTIDLNGFAIRGAAVCTGPRPVCTGTGDGNGIFVQSVGHVTVRNGTITGMPGDGIDYDTSSIQGNVIESVHVVGNGNYGMGSGAARVHGCSAYRNQVGGIDARFVLGSESVENGGVGFVVESTGMLLDSRATGNGGLGLSGPSGAYGRNTLTCNNSAGACTNAAQVGGGLLELAPNICGTDTTCP